MRCSRSKNHDGAYQVVGNNKWIRDCTGPWDALLLLATKPHQESCVHIDNYFDDYMLVTVHLTAVLDHLNSQFRVAPIVLKTLEIRTGIYF